LHWGSRNVPIQFWTSVERDLVVTKWWGDVTLDDFRDTFGMYLTDVNYTPGRTELVYRHAVARTGPISIKKRRVPPASLRGGVPGPKEKRHETQ
jgi:hypothetical protein